MTTTITRRRGRRQGEGGGDDIDDDGDIDDNGDVDDDGDGGSDDDGNKTFPYLFRPELTPGCVREWLTRRLAARIQLNQKCLGSTMDLTKLLLMRGGAGSFSEFGTITWYFSCIFPLAMFLTIFSNYDVNFL